MTAAERYGVEEQTRRGNEEREDWIGGPIEAASSMDSMEKLRNENEEKKREGRQERRSIDVAMLRLG